MDRLPVMNIYNASAGAGKTYTLVQEFLKICLNPDRDIKSFREILAVTFTNKAAGEMQERILERLKDFASEEVQEKLLFDNFCAEWSLSAIELRKRSSDVLIEILHDYTSFSVSTIDKFMLRIVRSFSLELGLNAGFEVFTDSNELISESVDLLMEDILPGTDLEQFAVEYARNRLDNDQKWTFEQELKRDATFLLNETHYNYIRDFLLFDLLEYKQLQKLIFGRLDELRKKFSKQYSTFKELATKIGVEPGYYSGGNRGIYTWANKLENIDLKISLKTPLGLQEKRDWLSAKGKKDDLAKHAIEANEQELNHWLDNTLSIILENLGEYTILSLLSKSVNRMALIGSVAQKMEHYMEQESMLHISEFNKKIAAFIRKEIVPFVYAKMGDRYRYFFIDEFQDTSRLQWDNVYPLLENSLAESGQVMLVGDGKQSIYRWRGGDVNILFEELAKKDKPISYQVEEIVLPSNWRSSKEIVSFNNALFKSLSSVFQSGAYNYIYDNAAQKIQKGTTGYVEINIAEEKENREERNKADLKRILEDAIHRNLNFKDIAIIARGNKDLKKLTSWLKDWEIPFINNESLLLKNNPSVEFIVHILYAVTFPKKKEYQIFVLEYLYRQKEADNGKFEAWISDYLDKENSTDWISFLQEQGIQFNPALLYQKGFYEWIEELVFIFSIEKDIYINFFLDACLDYTKRHKHNIEGFLNWWEKKKNDLAIKTDASSNAVELLTIHKSKGLEYPVVILPFMDWSRSLKGSEYWFDIGGITEIDIPYMRSSFSKTYTVVPEKVRTQYNSYVDEEIFDMLNMLYVGTTRAVSELYIMAYYKYKSEDYQYVNDLLLYYLEREENWNPEKEQYTLGEKSIRESSIKSEDVFTSYARSEMHWRGKIKIARQAPELWDLENFTSESDWGNLLHDTMADIEDRGDMEKAIRRQTNKRWLSTEEVEKLKASVKGILEHPDLKQYFDSPQEVYNEQDICIRNGNILRPDRLVKCKDGTWALLDYKTGAPFSDHRRQIEEYALLLRNMGYEGLEKILVYTANLKIEKWK